jgi:hypothetical protein
MQVIRKFVALLVLAGAASVASAANNLVINPATSVIGPTAERSFILQVLGTDFTDIVVGGGFDLTFDSSVLALNSVTINTALWEFAPSKGHQGPGTLTDVSFNTFVNSPTGNFLVATLGFTAKAPGATNALSALTLSASDIYSFSNLDGQEIAVNFASKPFSVTVSAVPLPPTAWLFASGLAMLGFVRLQRREELV